MKSEQKYENMHNFKKYYNMLLSKVLTTRTVLMLIYLITVIFVFSVITYLMSKSQTPNKTAIKDNIIIDYSDNGLNIHIKPLDDAIVPRNSSIFFIESHTGPAGSLTIRQGCSIESAAR